jgi:hypothetical protein
MKLHAQWIVGFVDAEGCFHVAINQNKILKCGYQVLPEFTVTQHKRDIQLLYQLKDYFECGVVRINHDDRYCYRVRGFGDLTQRIIPFFKKHELLTQKRLDFEKFCKVCIMMKNKQHLNLKGIDEIRRIQETMNRKGAENKKSL